MTSLANLHSRHYILPALWVAIVLAILVPAGRSTAQEAVFYPAVYWPNAATPDGAEAIPLAAGEARTDLDLHLTPGGGIIFGSVRSEGGQPLAGVLLVAQGDGFLSHAFSETDGSFSISGVAPGNNVIRAWTFDPLSSHRELMPLYAPSAVDSVDAEVIFAEPGRATASPELVLRLGARIHGMVASSQESEGIPGVRVEAHRIETGQVFFSYTRETGDFLLQGLLPGSYVVGALTGETPYLDEYFDGAYDFESADIIILLAPDEDDVTLMLEKQGRILGKVTAEGSSEGLPGLEVIGTEQGSGFVASTITDDDGFYTLGKLRAGSYILFVPAIGKYWLDAETEDRARRIDVHEGEDILSRNFEGFILDDCPGIPEVLGVITGNIVVRDGESEGGWFIRAESENLTRELHVDNEGEYTLDCLTGGDYTVNIRRDSTYAKQYYDKVRFESEATLVTVVEGDTADAIDFFPEPGGRIGGTVLTAKESFPVQEAPVQIRLEETATSVVTRTDVLGRFLVGRLPDGTGLPEGTYKVSVDSFSTGHITPTPVLTLHAWTQAIRSESGWLIQVFADLPFDSGPFLIDLLRRGEDGQEDVVASASPAGTGGGVVLLEDPAPPPGAVEYKVVATGEEQRLESVWIMVELPDDAFTHLTSLRSGPNPSRSGWTLSVELQTPACLSLDVFSVDGRLLWRETRSFTPGEHIFSWNGRGRDGRPVATGVYTFVLRAVSGMMDTHPGRSLASGRLILVR